jgi:hypothetical protein
VKYEVVEGLFLLEDGRDGFEEVLHLQLFEVFQRDVGFKDNVDPSCQLVGRLHANEADILLLGSDLPAYSNATLQKGL